MSKYILDVDVFLKDMYDIVKRVLEINELGLVLSLETELINGVDKNNLDLSSIDFVAVVVEVEEHFDITFNFDIPLQTMADIYNYIVDFKRKNNKSESIS